MTSPFRIVEPSKLHLGVAMISEDEPALRVHEALATRLWETALKGAQASAALETLLAHARPAQSRVCGVSSSSDGQSRM